SSELERLSGKRNGRSMAADCLELVSLLRAHALKIQGDAGTVAAQLDEAAAVGAELAGRCGNGAPAEMPPQDMRDRLWRLPCFRHGGLWRIGAYLFGRRLVDKRVPPLGWRVKKKKARALASL